MRSRPHPATAAVAALLFLLTAGCDLTSDESIFNSTALSSGNLLFAGHSALNGNAGLELRVMNTVNSVTAFGVGSYDFSCPDIMAKPNGTYVVAFGKTSIRIIDTFTMGITRLDGIGSEQRALNFDRENYPRFAYMDGSETSGFDILVQNGIEAAPVAVTSDASSAFSYWTPCWSPDGEWILYAKVPDGATSGEGCELWRVSADGTGAEKLPIVTTEVPTYAVFSPNGNEVFVPGDFTSYYIADGAVGKFDHIRDTDQLTIDLAGYFYEMVGSPVTGPLHEGEEISSMRHTFPISAIWRPGDKLYVEGLVAANQGEPPHRVLGIGVFTYLRDAQRLLRNLPFIPISSERSDGHSISIVHPMIIP